MLHTVLNYVSLHQGDLLGLFGGAAGLSVLLESILLKLKRSKWHIDSKKLSYTLLHVFTVASTIGTYIIGNLPKADAGAVYATLTIAAETWHRFAVSPFYNKYLVPFLDYQAENKAATVQTNTVVPKTPSLDPSGSVSPDSFLGED